MFDSEDLQYSSEASATRYMYYKDLNDINIFVEDTGKEYEYETIFNRIFQDEYCISAIIALGGKKNVRDKFLEFGTENKDDPKIKNFYIVDGDFDRYIGEEMIESPCFIYLQTYNIESYILDEEACIQFSKGRLKCLDAEVRERINFKYWKETIVNQATKLFFCYCFIKKYHPQISTLSRSSYEFIDMKTGFERCDHAYQQYWENILALDNKAEEKTNEIKEKYKEINGTDYYNLICGKFLFDSLCCYLRSKFSTTFYYDDFRWHLINHFDVSKLDYVKETIVTLTAS